jgi:hypothetical protein
LGKFFYQDDVKVTIGDRALAHVQFVVTTKLRRGEKFTFSWQDDASVGHGRTSVWLSAGTSIAFTFSDGRQTPLNRMWLDELMRAADSPAGLYLVPEPTPDPAP